MGVVIQFKKAEISAEDVLRYFFQEINQAHNLNLSLQDPHIKPHLTALKSLADVYIHTATKEIEGVPEAVVDSLCQQLDHLRARFLAETVLGILVEEGVVRRK